MASTLTFAIAFSGFVWRGRTRATTICYGRYGGMRSLRDEIRRRNQEAEAELAAATKERIVEMLDEEQAAQYEKQLRRGHRRVRRERHAE